MGEPTCWRKDSKHGKWRPQERLNYFLKITQVICNTIKSPTQVSQVPSSNRIITLFFPSLPSSIYTLESTTVGKPPAVQSEVHCRGQVVRRILRLRQPSLPFYTVSNQAVLKGNFWISLFVQCSWMRHLVHVLSNLKADLSHRSWSREWVTGRNSGWSCVLLRLS